MDPKYIVAIELSSSQIKGAVACVERRPDGSTQSKVDALAVVDDTSSVRYGRIQNLAEAAKQVMNIREHLQDSPALKNMTITGAYVGIEGRSLISEHVSATLELPTEMEITTEILKRLYAEAAKCVSPEKKTLRILPRKYIVDNQAMNNPVGAPAHRLRGEFTVVTCNPVNERYLDMVFKQRVELPVIEYVVVPLAIADMVLDEEEKQLGCVLVDFGFQTTTISIYKDRALQYLATLPLGSQNITLDISSLLNCTIEKAEAVKIAQGDARPSEKGDSESSRINQYIQARANEIIANIKAQIEYAGFKTSDLSGGFILTGRASKLRNFDSLLENFTKLRVRTAQISPSINFHLSDPTLNPTDYLSLMAIIDKVSHRREITDCVSAQQKPVEEPAPQPVQPRPETPAQRKPISEDDENLLQDDPEPNKQKVAREAGPDIKIEQMTSPEKKQRRGMIAKLKMALTEALSDDKDENI